MSKTTIAAMIFILLGILSGVIQQTFYGYIDTKGVIHDSIFLPLAFICLTIGILFLLINFVHIIIYNYYPMLNLKSITGRLIVGKTLGFLLGGIAFFIMPFFVPEISMQFNLGMWLLFILMGVMIGFIGIFTTHPFFNIKMPWWIHGSVVGGTFGLLLALLSYDTILIFMNLEIVQRMGFHSPYWVMIDTTIYGLIISYVTKKISGDGKLPLK
jgi:hypothetical protein